ncbi:type IV pili twitching motility protein PilT [Sorangium cellulosum]|uniref:Type IV pili twitching motility protein PilT n=2 Tax=Sorangium cellulosum TaxID=56 RepID=A0A150PPY1_SORCE|nr:type IV pilus twitching motility protein PilT [Sorangium cellulosum]AGP32568.1 twitching motility protein pilT [Sorangium cellulosum So0157-2]KYF57710.1 type IV pili twitching motility protein PilT [Sorangium cellulosum]KYG03308.1 type IV pili twitching motility protein PilT [Sorangium cellulosum]
MTTELVGQQEGLRYTLQQLLRAMVEKGASDMHITSGTPPLLRIDGTVVPLKLPPLMPGDTRQLCYSVLSEEQVAAFEQRNELDLSFGMKGLARFRANIYMQRGAVAAAFRQIPFRIMNFDELGLPPVVLDIAAKPRGLVLVTGPTGSGKTTTLASIIDKINAEQRLHILTIEDPIEYLHPHKLSLVNQREIGSDTASFKDALRYALRQDPDVVLVGEMRDLETVESALTIAETGHLVFATLHTNSAISTINRIIDVFPPHQQSQVRQQLSFTLVAVMTQLLLPRANGPGRVMAMEVMIPNAAIRNLIREDKLHQIYSQMQVGQAGSGMQTMAQSLVSLYQRRMITLEEMFAAAADPDEIRAMLEPRPAMSSRNNLPKQP